MRVIEAALCFLFSAVPHKIIADAVAAHMHCVVCCVHAQVFVLYWELGGLYSTQYVGTGTTGTYRVHKTINIRHFTNNGNVLITVTVKQRRTQAAVSLL